jgi:hypothetical protein
MLSTASKHSIPSPAGLPELDQPGWTSDDFVRDFPIDFTLLLENLSDPDHGLFAHQTPNFDSFAASAEFPMQVSTEQGRGGPKVRRLCCWLALILFPHGCTYLEALHMPGTSCVVYIACATVHVYNEPHVV